MRSFKVLEKLKICEKKLNIPNPLAKNAEWINERKHLEESRQNDVHEVVLSSTSNDSNGLPIAQAVEGTQTNLFEEIVAALKQGIKCIPVLSGDEGKNWR